MHSLIILYPGSKYYSVVRVCTKRNDDEELSFGQLSAQAIIGVIDRPECESTILVIRSLSPPCRCTASSSTTRVENPNHNRGVGARGSGRRAELGAGWAPGCFGCVALRCC